MSAWTRPDQEQNDQDKIETRSRPEWSRPGGHDRWPMTETWSMVVGSNPAPPKKLDIIYGLLNVYFHSVLFMLEGSL